MIYAITGQTGCGKTRLFQSLKACSDLKAVSAEYDKKNTFCSKEGDVYLSVSPGQLINLKAAFGEEVKCILLESDDDIRMDRLIRRERTKELPDYGDICRNYLKDKEDMKKLLEAIGGFDYVCVNNGDFYFCFQEIYGYIKSDIKRKKKHEL